MLDIIFLIISILLGTFGQIAFKSGMSKVPLKSLKDAIPILRNPFILCGLFLYGISALLYIFALKSIKLSVAYPLVSISYVLVTGLSILIFKESVSKARWGSVLLICLGVILVGIRF